jgi:hypothetical protein
MILSLPRITALARFLVGFHRAPAVGVRDCPAFALELEREGRERFRLIPILGV